MKSSRRRARPQPPKKPRPKPRTKAPSKAPKKAGGCASLVGPNEVIEFSRVDSTSMFDTLGKVRALPTEEMSRAIVVERTSARDQLSRVDLRAASEIGRHYLMSGGLELAKVIFEGLAALDPKDSYALVALGLTHDRMNEKAAARRHYQKAQRVDPENPVPLINLAELDIESGKIRRARQALHLAARLARERAEPELARKAQALLTLTSREGADS